MDDGLLTIVLWSIVYSLFDECSTVNRFFKQLALCIKRQLHFDLLEAAVCSADQAFADDEAIAVIIQAEIVIQVHATFDDLTAAIAFHEEDVEAFIRFGGCSSAEEIFEEAHVILSTMVLGLWSIVNHPLESILSYPILHR